MDHGTRYRVSLAKAMMPIVYMLTYAMLASGSLAGLLYITGLTTRLPLGVLIALSPVLYLSWLVLFLGWGYLVGLPFYAWVYKRPSRMSDSNGPR